MTSTTTTDGPRSLWPAALIMTGVIAVLVVVFVAFYPDDGSGHSEDNRAASATTQPRIITRPEDGVGPEEPGDPGGWQQLALLGGLVIAIGTVGLLVWRSSRKARAPT